MVVLLPASTLTSADLTRYVNRAVPSVAMVKVNRPPCSTVPTSSPFQETVTVGLFSRPRRVDPRTTTVDVPALLGNSAPLSVVKLQAGQLSPPASRQVDRCLSFLQCCSNTVPEVDQASLLVEPDRRKHSAPEQQIIWTIQTFGSL